MKSIKEKSNEYAREYLFSPLPQRAPNVHFEVGANYVLEEIEKVFNESVNPSTYQDTYRLNKIHDLIIELKKG